LKGHSKVDPLALPHCGEIGETQRRVLSVAQDFSQFPAGRVPEDGPYSGAQFRDELLLPALREGPVTLLLDGTMGYGSSFLKEAFGPLKVHFTAVELRHRLLLESKHDPSLVKEIWTYLES
jgi:STAS-like domain of unknown function (DUF4325)